MARPGVVVVLPIAGMWGFRQEKSTGWALALERARTYLDYNATAPVRPEAAEAVARALVEYGNPSSVHAEGRRARAAVELAREQVAALVGTASENVVFTSGATEAANQLLTPRWGVDGMLREAARAYPSAIEHPCFLQGGQFRWLDAVKPIGCAPEGRVDIAALKTALIADAALLGRPVVAVMAANNETGVIQPVAAAAEVTWSDGGFMICDVTQAVGRIEVSFDRFPANAFVLSSHKIGGPSGTGAAVFSEANRVGCMPLISGGGQERGNRGGTENVAGIAGFGVAAELALRDLAAEGLRLATLRDAIEAHVRRIAPDAVIFGETAERLPNTTLFAVPGIKAETLLMAFDLAGIAVSSGSACSSGKVGRSHVLAAMGVDPDLAAGAIRVSLGWASTPDDVTRFAEGFETIARSLHENRSRPAA
jgi:cysteine desulfurase